MTYYVSIGMLNSTHSLTLIPLLAYLSFFLRWFRHQCAIVSQNMTHPSTFPLPYTAFNICLFSFNIFLCTSWLVTLSGQFILSIFSISTCQQCTDVCTTRPPSTWSIERWLRHPAQYSQSSGLLCRRSDGLKLTTRQSPWPGAQQRLFWTTIEDELISALPLSTQCSTDASWLCAT